MIKDLLDDTDDYDVIRNGDPKDLWVYDKLKLSKFLKYDCGDHNEEPIESKEYIVRPRTNPDGMGIGAIITKLNKSNFKNILSEGLFWCEVFSGRHMSYDFEYGKSTFTVEGIKGKGDPIWRWDKWILVDEKVELPNFLKPLSEKYRWINFETIGGKIIEVHLRPNTNFLHKGYKEVIPVWDGDVIEPPKGYKFVNNRQYKRVGLYVK